MKKLLVLLLTAACALCLAFAVAGCKPDVGESSGGTNTQQGDTENKHTHTLEENQLVCKTCGEQLAESLNFKLKSDDTYNLTSGTPTSDGKITIPKIYNGLPVTSIGNDSLKGCTNLTSITIPDSVTSIGNRAFYRCENLERVYITDIAAWCNIDFDNDYDNPLYLAHNLYLDDNLVTDLELHRVLPQLKSMRSEIAQILKA